MHCADEMSHSNITNLFAVLKRVQFSSLMEHALHSQYKLKSYSLIFPAAGLCPSELINEICHHAKPLCLTTFPQTPQLPDADLPPAIHTFTISTHVLSHISTIEQWEFYTGRQAGRQTASQTQICIQHALQSFFFSSFFSRLNKQTPLSCSLYSCVGFCVGVYFNLNGFQVPSFATSVSFFSPLIQLTLKLSSSTCHPHFSHFLSTLKRPHIVPFITLCSSLLFTPFGLTFFLCFLPNRY